MTSRARKFLVSLFSFGFVMLVGAAAFAQPMAPSANNFERDKWIALAAGFGIAIAAFGGALGQAKTAATALDGIARNPGAAGKIFTPMILGLALIESLVIYSLLISFLLQGKIGG